MRRCPDPNTGRSTSESSRVDIRALGRFEVVVGGRPVPGSAWQSRRARDLLRVLVARRGRPVPPLELSEQLWPDDDPFRTGHRLSVLLSIVRAVCGQDVLISDTRCVALDLTTVRVDVEEFLHDVGLGVSLIRRGEVDRAWSVLTAAEGRYGGEPFADDPYADWAASMQDEVRGAYLRAVRLLADLSAAAGDREHAAAYLRRLLIVDAYDEAAHEDLVGILVRWGRHGEARRAFRRYGAAMAAIGVRGPHRAILFDRNRIVSASA